VSEKGLKGDARSHQARLVDLSPQRICISNNDSLCAPNFRGVHKPRRTATTYKMGETFAIFHFKYRSLGKFVATHVSEPSNQILQPL
jgi:hypothetical protein